MTLGLFELSAYQPSDIATWAHRFYGPGYPPPLSERQRGRRPVAPGVPARRHLPARLQRYAGDIEVDADIETTLPVAPDLHRSSMVYNAPNDETGQTEIDEYSQIAQDDIASSVSSSWGFCENDVGEDYAEAENMIFEQMALQGQSMFNVGGRHRRVRLHRPDGTGPGQRAATRPPSPGSPQSAARRFENDNPGTGRIRLTRRASRPSGTPDNLCHSSANEDGSTGLLLVHRHRCGWRRVQPVLGPSVLPEGPGVNSPTPTAATARRSACSPTRNTVSRDARRLGRRGRVDPVRRVLHRQRGDGESGAHVQRRADTAGVVRGSAGPASPSPVWAAVDRRPQRVPGAVGPVVPTCSCTTAVRSGYAADFFPRHHRAGGRARREAQRALPRPARGYDLATGIGTPIMAALITGTR